MANFKIPKENITGSFSLQCISGSAYLGFFSPMTNTNINNIKIKQLSISQTQIIMEMPSSLAVNYYGKFYHALMSGAYYNTEYSYGLGPDYE